MKNLNRKDFKEKKEFCENNTMPTANSCQIGILITIFKNNVLKLGGDSISTQSFFSKENGFEYFLIFASINTKK